jgi:hypothetical protein
VISNLCLYVTLDTVIRLRVGHSVVQIPAEERNLSSPKRPEMRWGPLSPCLVCIMGCFPGIKRRKREVGHQSLSSADVKNEWNCASTSPTCRSGVCRDTLFHFYDKCIATCILVRKMDEFYYVHIDGSFPIPDRGLVCESRKQVGHLAIELDSSSDSCRFLTAKRESCVTSWLVRARAVYVHSLGEVAVHKEG